ncbi:TPA: hypothetical protein ACH3X1_014364 [Trebouxia sp. C0004]
MQMFTKKTINITSSPKTGDKTFEHMKEEIQELESHNKVTVICVVSDAAGEASKARRLLREWKPSLMTLDCYSHQFNLSVGDYLKSKKTNHMYLEVVSEAVELVDQAFSSVWSAEGEADCCRWQDHIIDSASGHKVGQSLCCNQTAAQN